MKNNYYSYLPWLLFMGAVSLLPETTPEDIVNDQKEKSIRAVFNGKEEGNESAFLASHGWSKTEAGNYEICDAQTADDIKKHIKREMVKDCMVKGPNQ